MDVQRIAALAAVAALAACAAPAGVAHAQEGETIPAWVRAIFVYYADNQITDAELINAIEFLIAHDVIQTTTAPNQASQAAERPVDSRAAAAWNARAEGWATYPAADAAVYAAADGKVASAVNAWNAAADIDETALDKSAAADDARNTAITAADEAYDSAWDIYWDAPLVVKTELSDEHRDAAKNARQAALISNADNRIHTKALRAQSTSEHTQAQDNAAHDKPSEGWADSAHRWAISADAAAAHADAAAAWATWFSTTYKVNSAAAAAWSDASAVRSTAAADAKAAAVAWGDAAAAAKATAVADAKAAAVAWGDAAAAAKAAAVAWGDAAAAWSDAAAAAKAAAAANNNAATR